MIENREEENDMIGEGFINGKRLREDEKNVNQIESKQFSFLVLISI